MAHVHINIGSNLGNRQTNISRAIDAIMRRWPGIFVSPVVESEPWGFNSANRFLNAGVSLDTAMDPTTVFETLHNIEQHISDRPHRTRHGEYADRTIDIDMIFYDDIVLNSERLTLPHPKLHMRDFVLRPLALLEPSWTHPILKLTASQMLEALKNRQNKSFNKQTV